MGRPKAELTIGGKTFIDLAADALLAIADDGIRIVGGRFSSGEGLAVLPDVELTSDGERPGGALVGLYSAFTAAQSEWIAVLACDMPFVTRGVFERLAMIDRAAADAVVPVDVTGTPQPLCAFYRRAVCLTASSKCLDSGNRSLRALLDVVRTRFVPAGEFKGAAEPNTVFLNVNTPDDYDRAKQLIL